MPVADSIDYGGTGMAKSVMIQGTMSNAGKSLIAAAFCRIFRQDGYTVAPFKSQNMALNSYVTADGLEMGRAQVMQAEAAGLPPDVRMNPILLKPTSDVGSQVIVNGEIRADMTAKEYFKYKKELMPEVLKAYHSLAQDAEIIVIEGAGSPAEINLRERDLVNMGLAEAVDAPVLLVGDIDRGGVFAQLYGTVALMPENEQRRIRGLLINKFRGDKTILDPGLKTLEELCHTPVLGVIPYTELDLDDEDSLADRLELKKQEKKNAVVDIVVVQLPHMACFTDFNALSVIPEVSLRYIRRPADIGEADMLILPGSKATMRDRRWLTEQGFDEAIPSYAKAGGVIFGVCAGYQLLGESLHDPEGRESGKKEEGADLKGLKLLPVETFFYEEKHRRQVKGSFLEMKGVLAPLSGMEIKGYEIHQGRTALSGEGAHAVQLSADTRFEAEAEGACNGNVYGSYVHGIFDAPLIAHTIAKTLAERKGREIAPPSPAALDRDAYKEAQYDALAALVRENIDLQAIYRIMEEKG